MSAPVRFLVLAIAGWTAIRAATLGALPGFTVSYAKQHPPGDTPPIAATEFPPLPPVAAVAPAASNLPAWPVMAATYPPYDASYPYPYPYPYAVPASPPPAAIPRRPAWQLPSQANSGAGLFTLTEPAGDWQVADLAAFPQRQSRPAPPPVLPQQVPKPGLDRWQLTSWALLRGSPSAGALATGGTLGGSQAGTRLTYNFNGWLAASLRATSPVGGSRGAEVAGGVRFIPFRSIPVAITAERRQAISPHGGGRSDFALFAEGGLYRQRLPWRFNLDAYVQAGIVGIQARDLFADGALAVSRPVYGRFSAGFGVWGGFQPGIYRIDAGPRISVRLRDNIYAHVDWRQRLAGTAQPSSGPALTLAADF